MRSLGKGKKANGAPTHTFYHPSCTTRHCTSLSFWIQGKWEVLSLQSDKETSGRRGFQILRTIDQEMWAPVGPGAAFELLRCKSLTQLLGAFGPPHLHLGIKKGTSWHLCICAEHSRSNFPLAAVPVDLSGRDLYPRGAEYSPGRAGGSEE